MSEFDVMYGRGLKVTDLYEAMPHISEEDPEFMLDIFFQAKELCEQNGTELDAWQLMRAAKHLALTDFRQDFRSHANPRDQFLGSLIQPGLEAMRYLPKIVKRLGMDPDRECKPLWEYVEPDFMTRINFGHWNKVSHILDDLPELADRLREMEEKPIFYLTNKVTEHGTTASILGDDFRISLRRNLDEHDVPNALRFSRNLGPEVLHITNRWIIEDAPDLPKIETYDRYNTRHPFLYGNLLGTAVRQIHTTGYSYNDNFYDNIYIDPETDKLLVTNWCAARQDGNFEIDLANAKKILRARYLEDLAKSTSSHPHLSSYGTTPFIEAYKGFVEGYGKGVQIPLVKDLK